MTVIRFVTVISPLQMSFVHSFSDPLPLPGVKHCRRLGKYGSEQHRHRQLPPRALHSSGTRCVSVVAALPSSGGAGGLTLVQVRWSVSA